MAQDEEVTWVFYLFQGSEADALANRLNVRTLEYVRNPDATDDDGGCGCHASRGAGALPPLALAILLWIRRRRG